MNLVALLFVLLGSAFNGTAGLAPDDEAAGGRSGLEELEQRVVVHRLENGWTFLLLPRPNAPVVSFETYIDVGAVYEHPGITGMAHMFEHMAFKGSDRVGSRNWAKEKVALDAVETAYVKLQAARDGDAPAVELEAAEKAFRAAQDEAGKWVEPEEYSKILEDAGGSRSLNASTSSEETRYVVSLPKNRIELWCWMERERFTRGVLREFYKERDVVLEERNMSVESDPVGLMYEKLITTAFAVHPYRFPVIGLRPDLTRFTRTEAEAFFAENYGARRYITTLVGDFDPEQVIPLLDRYFGDVAPGPEPRPITAVEPDQEAERRATVSFPAQPMLILGWKVPRTADEDDPAVEVTARILGGSPSSRLNKRLLREDASAVDLFVEPGWPGNRYPNLLGVFALPSEGHATSAIESAIYEEVARLGAEGPTADELAAAVARARAELLRGMRSNARIADRLCEEQAKTGDWREAFRRVERLAAVTAEDVQRVVSSYLTPERRTVVTLVSEGEEQ